MIRLAAASALCALAAGCAAPSAALLAGNDYQAIIARSLGYTAGRPQPGRYEVSDPWRAVTGEIMVCLATHVPNGSGGYAAGGDYALYAIDGGRITAVDRPYPDCRMNTTYRPLTPAPKA